MPRSLAWRAFARMMAAFFALVPKRHRFRAAILICKAITPLIGSWLKRRGLRADWCSAPFDESMRLVMRALADGGALFDPAMIIDSDAPLEGRALYLSGHFPINAFLVRHLHDHGIEMVILKAFPQFDPFIWGTRDRSDAIEDSPAIFVKLLRRIEAGHPALLMIDIDTEPAIAFESEYGNGHVTIPPFDFAKRFDIPTFFCCVRCDHTGVPVVVIRRIEPDPHAFLARMLEQSALL